MSIDAIRIGYPHLYVDQMKKVTTDTKHADYAAANE